MNLIYQIIKFGIVGSISFVVDYGIMIALTEAAHVPYLWSCCISFSVAAILNYLFSVKWVFDTSFKNKKTVEFTVFLFMSIIGLILNELFMWLGVEFLHIHYTVAKIGATFFVMIYNFISRKLFLERKGIQNGR